MKHLLLFFAVIITFLAIVAPEPNVEPIAIKEPSDEFETDTNDLSDFTDEFDWHTKVTDSISSMTLATPFVKSAEAETEYFHILIEKQKGKSNKPSLVFTVPNSVDIKTGIDFQFLQMTAIDDNDTTIFDSEGPLHIALEKNEKEEISALLPEGAVQLPNGNTYDFIKKCNSYNQLMVIFHYKSGEEKNILVPLVTFTESYRKIE